MPTEELVASSPLGLLCVAAPSQQTAGPQLGDTRTQNLRQGAGSGSGRALLARGAKIGFENSGVAGSSPRGSAGALPCCGLSQRGIQRTFGWLRGGKPGGKCQGTHLARLSLGPAGTCSEKKLDGKAFPVLPKDYFGDILRGELARNQGENNSIYIQNVEVLKTLKTHLTSQKKTAHLSTIRKTQKSVLPSPPGWLAGNGVGNGTGRSAGRGRACSLQHHTGPGLSAFGLPIAWSLDSSFLSSFN